MKKLLLAVMVLVAGGLAAAPYVSGMLLDRQLKADRTFPGLPKGMVWRFDSLQRGYLHSTATSTLSIRGFGAKPVVLHFRHRIDQLPQIDGTYATIHTTWQPQDSAARARLAKVFGDQPVLALDTRIKLDGSTRTKGSIPAVHQDGVTFSGARIEATTRPNGHFHYAMASDELGIDQARLPRADRSGRTGTVRLKGLTIRSDGKLAKDGEAWDTDSRIGIKQIRSTDSASGRGGQKMTGLVVGIKSRRKADDFDVSMNYQVDHMVTPEVSLDDAQVRLVLSRLNAPAVKQMSEQIAQMSRQGVSDKRLVQAAMLSALPSLLQNGPRVALEPFKARLPQGPFKLDIAAELPPKALAGQLSLQRLISQLTIKGDLDAPMALLDAQMRKQGRPPLSEQIGPLLQRGYVDVKHGQLHMTYRFANGHLTLNGQPADDLLRGALRGG